MEVLTQEIQVDNASVKVFIRREDLIHPFVSGNKFRKLKYNLLQAKKENQHTLLTFGGAYSNHIAATAFAGKEHGFQTVGVIRGEELEAADLSRLRRPDRTGHPQHQGGDAASAQVRP